MKKIVVGSLTIALCLSSMLRATEEPITHAISHHSATATVAHAQKGSFFETHGFFWPADNKQFPWLRRAITGSILWGLVYYFEKYLLLTSTAGTVAADDTVITLIGQKLQAIADELNIDLNTISIYVSPIASSDQLFFSPNTIVIPEQLFNILTPDELLFAITHQLMLIKNGSTLIKVPAAILTSIASFYAVKNLRSWGDHYFKSPNVKTVINNGPVCYATSVLIESLISSYFTRYLIFNADQRTANQLGYDLALEYLQKVQVAEPYLVNTPSALAQTLKLNYIPTATARINALTNTQRNGYESYE